MMRVPTLAAVIGSLVITQAIGAPLPEGRGRIAVAAARIAAPHPPQTLGEVMRAMNYLTLHKWELFDTNHDGRLSRDEWLEFYFSTYCVFNVNGDGRILFDEFEQLINGPTHERLSFPTPMRDVHAQFDALDHGHKGYLTIDDFRGLAQSQFEADDLNHDGFVTQAELTELALRHSPR